MKKITLILAALLFSGCAVMEQNYSNLPRFGSMYTKRLILAYEGPAKPLPEVAVVSHNMSMYFVSVNGEKKFQKQFFYKKGLQSVGVNQVHFLPGTYDLEFCFHYSDPAQKGWCTTTIKRTVDLKAGSMTFFKFKSVGKNGWTVEQVDMSSDKDKVEQEFKEMLQY